MTEKNEVLNIEENALKLDKESVKKSFLIKESTRLACEERFSELTKLEITEEVAKEAKELRLEIRPIRTGIEKMRKAQKDFFLSGGNFVDAYAKAVSLPLENMENELMQIEKHFENLEAERLEAVKQERIAQLEEAGVPKHLYIGGIAEMAQDLWDNYLSGQVLAIKAQKEAEAKAEQDRIAKEKEEWEEQERKDKELAELRAKDEEREAKEIAEKAEREAKEAKEQAERDRLQAKEKAKADKEKADLQAKLDSEREEKERLAKIEADRLAEEEEAKKREANTRHKGLINRGIVEAIQELAMIDEAGAKAIVKAIAKGEIKNVSINY